MLEILYHMTMYCQGQFTKGGVMKKIIGLLMLTCLFLVNIGYCADEIDIPEEVRPTVNKVKADTMTIHFINKTAYISIRKGYIDGNFVHTESIELNFINLPDNPNTPEDESTTDFDDFMTTISIDKPALRTLIQEKMGE